MFGWVRRGCLSSCLGCLLPLVLLAAVLVWGAHLMLTAPTYPATPPASPAAVQLAAARGVEAALATQQPVALVELTDAEATSLLQESLPGYVGLSNLEVHSVSGRIVVSGQTAILGHPLTISGPVTFKPGAGSVVRMTFHGLWIGQLGLPQLIPELLTKGLHPQFDLALVAVGRTISFACAAAIPGGVKVGVYYTSARPPAASACAGGT